MTQSCEVTFKVRVHTNLNQHVRIVGSINTLGLWDPLQALQLTTNNDEYPYWSNPTPLILAKGTRFEFKIVTFYNEDVERWEQFEEKSNRKYKVKFYKTIINCNEGEPTNRETVIEKLIDLDSFGSIGIYRSFSISNIEDKVVLRKRKKELAAFNPFNVAASDDSWDSPLKDEASHSSSPRSGEEFATDIPAVKTSFYHSPYFKNDDRSFNMQRIDHGQKMKELYKQMRSQSNNRIWHFSTKFTFHDAFYGVNEDDLTIFEEQEMVYIVTFYLPVIIEKYPNGSYKVKLNYTHELLALYEYCKKHQKNRFIWIGLHEQINSDVREAEEVLINEYSCYPVFLSQEMMVNFKYQCKNYLWCHLQKLDINNKFEESTDFWTIYQLVNYRIAEKILSVYDKGYILINDYRFLLVPSLCIRQKPLMKFHYILNFSFPSSNSFFSIPFYLQIINSILLSWVLSFESHDDMINFVDAVQEIYGGKLLSQSGYLTLRLYGRFIILNANAQLKREYLLQHKGVKPILNLSLCMTRKASLHLDFEFNQTIFLSVDSLNLREGIESKFKAIERILQKNPEMIGKIKLIQIFKFNLIAKQDEEEKVFKQYKSQAAEINKNFSSDNYTPIEIVIYNSQDPAWIKNYYHEAHAFIDINVDKSDNAHLRSYMDYKGGKSVIIINEEVAERFTDFAFTFTVNPIDVSDVTSQIRDCFDIIVNLNDQIACNLYNGKLPLNYVEDWLLKSSLAISKANLLMRNAKIFNTYVLSKNNTEEYMLAACALSFKKPNLDDIPIKYTNASVRVFLLPFEILLTKEAQDQLKVNMNFEKKCSYKDIDIDLYEAIEKICESENNVVAVITKRSKTLLDNTLGNILNIHLLAENGCFYRNTRQGGWINLPDETFDFGRVKTIMLNYQRKFESLKIKEKVSEIRLIARNGLYLALAQEILEILQKEIEIVVENNDKLEVLRFDNYVCVRPNSINKGAITQILLQMIFQERGKIGFLFCLGKTPSDEEMFAGIHRSLKLTQEIFTEVKQIFTCALGHRPSYASYYLNTKEEVKSLFNVF